MVDVSVVSPLCEFGVLALLGLLVQSSSVFMRPEGLRCSQLDVRLPGSVCSSSRVALGGHQ